MLCIDRSVVDARFDTHLLALRGETVSVRRLGQVDGRDVFVEPGLSMKRDAVLDALGRRTPYAKALG